MGCCAQTQSNMIIKSSIIPHLYHESLENEKTNIFQKSNSIFKIIIPRKKIKSDKTPDYKTKNEKNKTEIKKRKSMNIFKEASYNEVCECTK